MRRNKLISLLPLVLALLSGCNNDSSVSQQQSGYSSESTTVNTTSDYGSITDLTTEETSISSATSDSGENSETSFSSNTHVSSEQEQSSNNAESSDNEQSSENNSSEDEFTVSASWPTAEISAFAALINVNELFPHVELTRVIHHGVYDYTPTYGHYHLDVVSSDLNDYEVIKAAYNNAGYNIEITGDNFSGMSASYNTLIQGAYFANDATYGDMFTVDIYIYPTY